MDKKEFDYAKKLMLALADVLENEENDNFIDLKSEDADLTALIYAMGTIAPCYLLNKLTNDTKNHLDFNHLQNHLCFQYSTKEV